MKLPKDFPNLDALLKRIGVPFQPFVGPEIISRLGTKGVVVGNDEVKPASNGTLEYQGRKVILYIRDVKGSLPKYHVVNCSTLVSMQSRGKHKRYVVTRRTDGEFILNFADNLSRENPETHRLDICKNCLWGKLKLRNVYDPDKFPLLDWFNAIDPGYQPPPIDTLYGPRNYSSNWSSIKLSTRLEFALPTVSRES